MSSTNKGLVSVILPTHYRNDLLQDAVKSVFSQSYDNIELIVVDDSGERYAEEIMEEYDAKYVAHEENRGANVARNTGITRSSGEYIQLLDDDDRLRPDKVSKQVQRMQSNTEIGVVYSGLEFPDGKQIMPFSEVRGQVLEDALRDRMGPCITSTMLLRGEVIRSVHPLNERSAADDTELKIQLALDTEFDYVDEALVVRGRPDSSRGSGPESAREFLSLIDEYSHLYAEFPVDVQRSAFHRAYRRLGAGILEKKGWSPTAVLCYFKSFYYNPNLKSFGMFLSSLFGSKGKQTAGRLWRKILDQSPNIALL